MFMTTTAAFSWLLLAFLGAPTFEENLESAKKALRAKDLDAARKALGVAETQLAALGPNKADARYVLVVAQGDLEVAGERWASAGRRYQLASHLAEDDRRRRGAALRKRLEVATKTKAKRTRARLLELQRHDEEVYRALRRPRVGEKDLPKLEAKLQLAARAYQRDRDPARAAWARALSSRSRSLSSADPEAALLHASKAVHLVSRLPAFVRLAALEAGIHAARRTDRTGRELEFALEHNAITNHGLSAELRPFTRTRLLQDACGRYEKAEGAGACAIRARAVTGEWSFVDFGKAPPRTQLGPEDLAAPNAQYLPSVKECVEQVARENVDNELFQEAKVTVSFVINEAGQAQELEFAPKRYERFFGECVGSAVQLFRYPRSAGERQTVSVAFELSAPATRLRRGG